MAVGDPIAISLLPLATVPDDDDQQVVVVDGVTSRMSNLILKGYFQAGLNSVVGNVVTAPNDTTIPWKVVSFDNTPAVNFQEWRTPGNSFYGSVGPEWVPNSLSFISMCNVFDFKLINNGTTTTPPVGIQNGQGYFYYTP